MYQVTFSEQSIRELNRIDKLIQLELLEPLGNLTARELEHPREPLGSFTRDGIRFFRLRSGDYRFYFEIRPPDSLFVHYILHSNSWTDFVFRTKLPVSEEQLLEQHQSFWKYLETLGK
ncbi:MAG: cytotoxic translational repressor of toxin-antitoxin stability system [Puniceicoccaceae bacterium]|nr:MAG: cytotoxic translational repressor of toxin-antitoxin stability system [Puniceicoccaceae bacterium]